MVDSSIRIYSLSELTHSLRESIGHSYPGSVMVCAEISQLSLNSKSGHCYLDLIEKDPCSDSILAKLPAVIWRSRYSEIAGEFLRQTGMPLAAGISVMATATVEFSELYGLKLFISSIDPTYTLGDMAMRRREIIATLEREGVSQMNRSLPLPRLMRRIAVISSETAAGYEDFILQLKENTGGYIFYTRLYPAVMQGAQTEESVAAALSAIADRADSYDCVAIIRGGGAVADLQAFDSLTIARICAQFPIPVLTGIGHTRDESVVDMVACRPLKTPTAVAAFLIDRMASADSGLTRLLSRVKDSTASAVARAQQQLTHVPFALHRLLSRRTSQAALMLRQQEYILKNSADNALTASRHLVTASEDSLRRALGTSLTSSRGRLDLMQRTATAAARRTISREAARLNLLGEKTALLDPARLLSRGYTLTECAGRIVTSAAQLKAGDSITTRFADGSVTSTVEETHDIRI